MLLLVCSLHKDKTNRHHGYDNIQEAPQEGDPPQEERDGQEVNDVPADRQVNEESQLVPREQQQAEEQQPARRRRCRLL